MDRKALSKRLEGLSSIFASETPIATDLKAMAYTLDKMADDKFKGILSEDYTADKAAESKEDEKDTETTDESVEAGEDCSNDCESDTDGKEKQASDAGLYWNREASSIVLASLVKDVTGSTLPSEQTPDGHKKAEKPSTLKEEQTPSISDSLDSDIVKKSKGPVDKSAADTAAPEDEKAPEEDAKDAAQSEVKDNIQPKVDMSGDTEDDPADTEASSTSLESLAKKENEVNAFVSEGVELTAPMLDSTLDASEAKELEGLFA
jgi:hypothetical protein